MCISYVCIVTHDVCCQGSFGNNLFVTIRVKLRTTEPCDPARGWSHWLWGNRMLFYKGYGFLKTDVLHEVGTWILKLWICFVITLTFSCTVLYFSIRVSWLFLVLHPFLLKKYMWIAILTFQYCQFAKVIACYSASIKNMCTVLPLLYTSPAC